MKRVAIVQSNYIPWKGYFDLIQSVDEFILLDDVQYTRRDWRNRNRIKTAKGPQWLTIPVVVKGKFTQKIKDTEVSELDWGEQHWKTLVASYSRSKYFREFGPHFEQIYKDEKSKKLSQINFRFISKINEILGIQTKVSWSMEYLKEEVQDSSERLLKLCMAVDATHYVSGPAAQGYLNQQIFRDQKIAVNWFGYENYPEYPQLYPPFDHFVSVIDLIFNVGAEASQFMKRPSFKEKL